MKRLGSFLMRNIAIGFFALLPILLLYLLVGQMMRNLTQRLPGNQDETRFRPAVVTIGPGRRMLAFIVEAHTSGDYTIFVPLTPTSSVGNVQIVSNDMVHVLDVPAMQALNCLLSWGDGTEALLSLSSQPRQPGQAEA